MANDWRRSNRHPSLESTSKIHINESGLADYLRQHFKPEETEPDSDILKRFETSTGAWVSTRATGCNYGGHRFWLVCPGCDGNRLVLRLAKKVNGLFCNGCLNAVHRITQMSKSNRRFNRRANIRERLGLQRRHGLRDRVICIDRPKNMHWKTFEPLMKKHNELLQIDLNRWMATSISLFESWGISTDSLRNFES